MRIVLQKVIVAVTALNPKVPPPFMFPKHAWVCSNRGTHLAYVLYCGQFVSYVLSPRPCRQWYTENQLLMVTQACRQGRKFMKSLSQSRLYNEHSLPFFHPTCCGLLHPKKPSRFPHKGRSTPQYGLRSRPMDPAFLFLLCIYQVCR